MVEAGVGPSRRCSPSWAEKVSAAGGVRPGSTCRSGSPHPCRRRRARRARCWSPNHVAGDADAAVATVGAGRCWPRAWSRAAPAGRRGLARSRRCRAVATLDRPSCTARFDGRSPRRANLRRHVRDMVPTRSTAASGNDDRRKPLLGSQAQGLLFQLMPVSVQAIVRDREHVVEDRSRRRAATVEAQLRRVHGAADAREGEPQVRNPIGADRCRALDGQGRGRSEVRRRCSSRRARSASAVAARCTVDPCRRGRGRRRCGCSVDRASKRPVGRRLR